MCKINIKDLPKELIDQLIIPKIPKNYKIISELFEGKNILNINEILIGFYKKTGDIINRRDLMLCLRKMVKLGYLLSKKGKRGVYQLNITKEK